MKKQKMMKFILDNADLASVNQDDVMNMIVAIEKGTGTKNMTKEQALGALDWLKKARDMAESMSAIYFHYAEIVFNGEDMTVVEKIPA